MKERNPSFPDKKHPNFDYDRVTKFIQENAQLKKESRVGQNEATWRPHPEYPDLPIAILLAADIHYGSTNVNYDKLNKHLQIVEDTPNFYMATNGDHIDNFSQTVFPSGMKDDAITPDMQTRIFMHRLLQLDRNSKIAALAQGNHDSFVDAAGYDFYQTFMADFQAPIFDNGGVLNIVTPGHNYRMIMTHQFWGKSKLNITNSPKRLLLYEGQGNCDIAWTGHTHQSAYEQFTQGDKEYIAVVSGTYKEDDAYAARRGLSLNRAGQPGMTLVLWPDQRKMQMFRDVETAQQYMLGLIFQQHPKRRKK